MAEITSGIVNSLFSGALAGAFWIAIALFSGVIILGFIYYFFIYKKQFDILVKVSSERFGTDKEFFDKGAILRDRKENVRYLRLLKTKVDLELPKFNIFRKTNMGDYVEVRRVSERGFMFLLPSKIEKSFFVNSDGRKIAFSQGRQKEIESDITFILNRERKNKDIINPESILLKVLEFMPQIISGMLSIFVLYFIFRYAPEWLSAMSGFVKELKEFNTPTIVGSIIGVMFSWKKKQ